jgi:hypothetical protein
MKALATKPASPAGRVQVRREAAPRGGWKPEDPKIDRAELRRIVLEMIG